MPFGKFAGMEIEEFGYEHLPYLNWLLDNVPIRSWKLKRAIECHVITLDFELYILEKYYSVEEECAS